ncbi:MAG: hypothetical protein ACREVZ_00340 [Burkholderiales bacterium]
MKKAARIATGVLIVFVLFMFGPTTRHPLIADAPQQLTISNVSVSGDVLAFGPAGAPAPTGILFDYDFTKAQNKACSATVTANCVAGFTLTTTSGTTQVGASVNVPLPGTISSTGITTNIAAPYSAPANLGSYSACLQVNYKDSTGVAQGGPTACTGFSILPDAPLNLRVQ